MCGIAGILQFSDAPVNRMQVRALLHGIAYRGPDGQGVTELGRCLLAHARLSIVDLPGGQQPMGVRLCPPCSKYAVVFNGEIYNHRQLRSELENIGHRFATDHSDTEVLLHGFHEWGHDLPAHLEGMFAFAIWDMQSRELFLARDRMGKKPLYHWQNESQLIFASSIHAIVAAAPPEVNFPVSTRALASMLQLGYTTPALPGMLRRIEESKPAQALTFNASGERSVSIFWRLPESPADFSITGSTEKSHALVDPLTKARELIREAVARRLDADVPLGCFLSGGIDSSIIAAMAHEQLMAQGRGPLQTFTIAMPDAAFDESKDAAEIAKHLGTKHTELPAISDANFISDLEHLTALCGEPLGDSSLLPTYWVSRATRQHVKVALSGDGGDELFAGYDRYRAMSLLAKHHRWIARLPAGFFRSNKPRSRSARVARLIHAARINDPRLQYLSLVGIFSAAQCKELGVTPLSPDSENEIGMKSWHKNENPLAQARLWDMQTYLVNDLLRKVDRASMAVALEVRCPLVDRDLMEWAVLQPIATLMSHGKPKGLLREIAAEMVPAHIARRPKRGFGIPLGDWFRKNLREETHARLTDGSLTELGLKQDIVLRYWDDHQARRADNTHRIFTLLSLAIWQRWTMMVRSNSPASHA